MAGSEPRPRIGRVFAAFVGLCFVAELVARAIVYNFAGEGFHSLSLYRWSAYGLVRNNPDLTSPSFKIDRAGFRSMHEFQKEKPKGTFRVMLFGGSVLYSGLGGVARIERLGRVRSDQTIADYLQAELDRDPAFAGRKVEVINAAVNFNRITETSASYLADYIHWKPDYVIVFGGLNNFATLRYQGDVESGKTVLQAPHPWNAEFERLVNQTGLAALIERMWRVGGEHSAALALFYKVAVTAADKWTSLTGGLAIEKPAAPPARPLETPSERQAYFDLYGSYANAFIGAARQQGTRIAFAWEPVLTDLGGLKPMSADELRIFEQVKRTQAEIEQYESARLWFHSFFMAQNVPVFDPTDDLKSWPQTVFIDYGHYTPDGNAFIARRLYAQLGTDIREQAARTR